MGKTELFTCTLCGKNFGFHEGVGLHIGQEHFLLCWPCLGEIDEKIPYFYIDNTQLAEKVRKFLNREPSF